MSNKTQIRVRLYIYIYICVCVCVCGPGRVEGIASGYGLSVRGSNPGGGKIFRTDPLTHPASCTMGTGYFPKLKSGRDVTLTAHPLLVPWSRKSRAVTLLPLWTVQPVQNLRPCTRVHFTFLYCVCVYIYIYTYTGSSKKMNGI